MNGQNNMIRLASPRAGGEVFQKLMRIPDVQMIYVSALACTRHRSADFVEMQRAGRLSFLLLSEVDMVTGDYIEKTRRAAAEIAAERAPSGIILLTGCQSALLSTDYKLLSGEIEQEIGIPVRVHDGCRLCGFDEESGGASAIDRLLYDFLVPSEKSGRPAVNLLGCVRPDKDGELFALLRAAGVEQINCLPDCKTFAEYQEMSRARVNIVTSAQDIEIGEYLEEKLGIPWVCLGGIYSGGALAASYEKLGRLLGAKLDDAPFQAALREKLAAAKAAVGGTPISVQGDAELAGWLLDEGFSVAELRMNPHQGLSPEQRARFTQYAPALRIMDAGRGGKPGGRPGKPDGRPDGRHGGRPAGRPGGRGGDAPALKLGYQGSMAALTALEQSRGGYEE